MKNRFYPSALNVNGKPCLVVGSDGETVEKAMRLASAGAQVDIVVESQPATISILAQLGIRIRVESFIPGMVEGHFLVVLSRKISDETAQSVSDICRQKRILLAALDRPHLCDVVHMSLFDRGKLHIGISTEGASPGLARKIREGLESSVGTAPFEKFLDNLSLLRKRLEQEEPDPAKRREKLLAAVEGFEFRAQVTFPPGDQARNKDKQ